MRVILTICRPIRIIEMRRILSERGSLYYHCDETMIHYIKEMLDIIFGEGLSERVLLRQTATRSSPRGILLVWDDCLVLTTHILTALFELFSQILDSFKIGTDGLVCGLFSGKRFVA